MSGQEHAATAASTGAMRKKRSASFSHEQERVRVKTKPNLLPGCTISSARSATVLTAEARIYNDASGTTAPTNVVAHGNGSSAVLNSSTKSSIDEKINIIRHGRSVIVKFLQMEEKERNEGKWVETMSGEKMEDLERIIIQQRSLIQQLMRERKKRSGAQFAAPNNLADAAHDQPATDQDDKYRGDSDVGEKRGTKPHHVMVTASLLKVVCIQCDALLSINRPGQKNAGCPNCHVAFNLKDRKKIGTIARNDAGEYYLISLKD